MNTGPSHRDTLLEAGFTPNPQRPRGVLIGEGRGITAIVHLAEQLHQRSDAKWKPLVLLGSESSFAFRLRPSTIMVAGMPDGVIAGLTSLDEIGIPSRLASESDLPGCHQGLVTELATAWLQTLDANALTEVELFACGSTALLNAVTQIANHFGVACQRLKAEG